MSHDSFIAVDDAGNHYTVHIRRSYISTGDLSNPHGRIEGLSSFHLATGGAVNKLDDETFEIVATGTVIRIVP
jgi:hypothetical protein